MMNKKYNFAKQVDFFFQSDLGEAFKCDDTLKRCNEQVDVLVDHHSRVGG